MDSGEEMSEQSDSNQATNLVELHIHKDKYIAQQQLSSMMH